MKVCGGMAIIELFYHILFAVHHKTCSIGRAMSADQRDKHYISADDVVKTPPKLLGPYNR